MESNNSVNLMPASEKALLSSALVRTIDHLNATNIYSFLRQNHVYQESKHHLAAYLSGIYQQSANAAFHNSLKWFEKLGFLSSEKQLNHFRRMHIRVALLEGAVPSILDIGLASLQYLAQRQAKKELYEFYLSMLFYVNERDSPLMQARAAAFARQLDVVYDFSNYRMIFQKYTGCQIGQIQTVNVLHQEEYGKIAVWIASSCDLQSPRCRDRVKEVCVFLGMRDSETEDLVLNVQTNGELFSDIVGFTGLSAVTIFKDLFNNAAYASEASTYSFDHDPFYSVRNQRKSLIARVGVTSLLASVTYFTGPLGDVVIAASMPAINSMLIDGLDLDKTVEIAKRLGALRRQMRSGGKR